MFRQTKGLAMFRRLSDDFHVAPQIALADVAEAKAAGFALIVNNRPDGEDSAAPQGSAIATAATKAGLSYTAIPVTHSGFSDAQIDLLDAAISSASGPVLAYCRSGTRSAYLWALSQVRAGSKVDIVCAVATKAGYDVSGLRPVLDALALDALAQ